MKVNDMNIDGRKLHLFLCEKDPIIRSQRIAVMNAQENITKRKRGIAREHKLIFNKLEELVEELGLEEQNITINEINHTYGIHKGETTNEYLLVDRDEDGKPTYAQVIAYDCFECGIVKGSPKEKKHKEQIHPLGPRFGITQTCYICDNIIHEEKR
jgi:phage/plasmid primase-like uncharacterized protein